MSFASLAPTEKTEHLVYSILPLSSALWFVSGLEVTDPIDMLTTVLALTSFFTILLYEFTPDQWLLNAILRLVARKRQSLKEAILIFNLLDRSWEKIVSERADWKNEDYFEKEVKRQVSIVVKSPHIRRITWRIRGSSWLFVSMYFIVGSYHNFLSGSSIGNNQNLSEQILVILRDNAFFVWIALLALIVIVGCWRHRKLFSKIGYFTRYWYLKNMIGMIKLEQFSLFRDSSPQTENQLDSLKKELRRVDPELDILNESLSVNDWELFLERWDNTYHWLHRKTVDEVERSVAYYLLKPISEFYSMLRKKNAGNPVDESRTEENCKKELGWICYFYELCDELTRTRKKNNTPSRLHDLLSKLQFWKSENQKLVLPDFSSEQDTLKQNICREDINLYDKNILFSFSDELLAMDRKSVAAAIMWAFASLEQTGKRHNRQERGLSLLLSQFTENKYNIQLPNAARMVLLGFKEDGIGTSTKIEDHESLKELKTYAPEDMQDEWTAALVRFIKGIDKDSLSPLTSDSNFVIESAKGRPQVKTALKELKRKFKKSVELKRILRKVG